MTNTSLKLLTLAATLTIAATTASAQIGVKAAIPFSFEVNRHYAVPAGSYSVLRQGSIWIFTNMDTGRKAVAPAMTSPPSKRTDGANMVFSCRGENCVLSSIQVGSGAVGGYFPPARLSKSDSKELARTVILPLGSAQ